MVIFRCLRRSSLSFPDHKDYRSGSLRLSDRLKNADETLLIRVCFCASSPGASPSCPRFPSFGRKGRTRPVERGPSPTWCVCDPHKHFETTGGQSYLFGRTVLVSCLGLFGEIWCGLVVSDFKRTTETTNPHQIARWFQNINRTKLENTPASLDTSELLYYRYRFYISLFTRG
jgi:hypothetical protein